MTQVKNIMFESDRGVIRVRYRTIDGKIHRLSPTKHPRFESVEEANEWRKSKAAYLQSETARIYKIKKQNEKYPEVTLKVDAFIQYKKVKKVKEHKTIHSYFNNYILNFYLNKLGITNINMWSHHHDAFLNYLSNGTQTKFKRTLSVETIRKIGFYLNEFYLFIYRKHLIEQAIPPLIVPDSEYNLKSLEDSYWSQIEFDSVIAKASVDLAEFITLLRFSGLRLNEAKALSLSSFISGTNDILAQKLKLYSIEVTGFIQLEGQLDQIRDGKFSIKPFKACPSVNPRYFRYVPISPELYVCISKRIKRLNIKAGVGDNSESSLIFNFNSNSLLNELHLICDDLGIKRRGFHSFRHTFATDMLIRSQFDSAFVGILTGHKSSKVFERYSHLIELLNFTNNSKNKRMF